MTNNQAEMYDLQLSPILAKDLNIPNMEILLDSLLTIQHLHRGSCPKENNLKPMLQRISRALEFFPLKSFFHILKHQNSEANRQANISHLLKDGKIEVNGIQDRKNIP